jgi:hypothetical protein
MQPDFDFITLNMGSCLYTRIGCIAAVLCELCGPMYCHLHVFNVGYVLKHTSTVKQPPIFVCVLFHPSTVLYLQVFYF